MADRRDRILAVVATDTTFERTTVRGEACWVGKCIHCNARLTVSLGGETLATIEHIVPRAHGGGDDVENLALACARCNAEKGVRHDAKPARDPRRLEIVAALAARRKARWRTPEE